MTGHEQRGTLYAVNTFLEEVLGVRWWTSTEQTVPVHKTLQLDSLDISYAPKLIYREAFYKDAFDPNVWIDVKDYDFQLFSLRWIPTNHYDSAVVEDSNASNGRAIYCAFGRFILIF